MMAAEPVMVPVFVVGLPQLPASILALPDMDATVMLPDTPPTWMLACPLISASTLRLRTLCLPWLACVARASRPPRAGVKRRFEIYSHGLRRRRLKPADASLFINARARNDKAEISSVWCW